MLTLVPSDLTEVGWKHIWYQNSPKTFYLGPRCPHPKNMKQQLENVYKSCLPTSQAEERVGIFMMKAERWLQLGASLSLLSQTEETGRSNLEVGHFLSTKQRTVSERRAPDAAFQQLSK